MRIGPKVITKVANSRPMQWAVNKASEEFAGKDGKMMPKLTKAKKHLPPLIGAWIASFYIINITKSKEIPEERKPALIVSNIITDGIGILGGYSLNNWIEKLKNKLKPAMEDVVRDPKLKYSLEKQAAIMEGFSSVVPLFAFTFAFRFFAPVVSTPLADKAVNFLADQGMITDPKKAHKNTI